MSMTVGESQTGVRVEEEPTHVRARGADGGDGLSLLPAAVRLRSLDVFRGMTVAGMILVNNPGTWGAIYSPLKHAEWHGWTPTPCPERMLTGTRCRRFEPERSTFLSAPR